jgi:hypothetical protein
VKSLLAEIDIAVLTDEQLQELCETGEKAARAYIVSRVPKKEISTLDITVDTEGRKPVIVNVEVETTLSPSIKDVNVDKLAKEAVEKAFEAIERYLRELSCKSTR